MTTIVGINPAAGPYYPGQLITLILDAASPSGKSLSCPAGAVQAVEEDAQQMAFYLPNPRSFGNRSLNFNSVVFTVTDGAESDTIGIVISPEPEWFFGEVAALAGINANAAATVAVGDWRYGYWHTGGGLVDYPSGNVTPNDKGVLRSYRRDVITGIWSVDYVEDEFIPPLADNAIVLRNFSDPPVMADVSPIIDTSPEGWEGVR